MLKETYFEMINFCLQMFDDIKIGVEGNVNKNELLERMMIGIYFSLNENHPYKSLNDK